MITIDPPSPSFPAQQKAALSRFLTRVRTLVKLPGHVEVLLTSDAELKRLNRTFRGKNKPTDILSFPAPAELPELSGDLAISLDTAARQAAEHGHTVAVEIKILLLHGLLHLAGEDHEADQGEMAAREAQLRRELKLPLSLIERAGSPKRKAR
jgi:probable rRNA maturation factor